MRKISLLETPSLLVAEYRLRRLGEAIFELEPGVIEETRNLRTGTRSGGVVADLDGTSRSLELQHVYRYAAVITSIVVESGEFEDSVPLVRGDRSERGYGIERFYYPPEPGQPRSERLSIGSMMRTIEEAAKLQDGILIDPRLPIVL